MLTHSLNRSFGRLALALQEQQTTEDQHRCLTREARIELGGLVRSRLATREPSSPAPLLPRLLSLSLYGLAGGLRRAARDPQPTEGQKSPQGARAHHP